VGWIPPLRRYATSSSESSRTTVVTRSPGPSAAQEVGRRRVEADGGQCHLHDRPAIHHPAVQSISLGPHLLPAVRGDLLAKLGRGDEARAEFQRAAELTRNERERDVLLARARPEAYRQPDKTSSSV
jgi:hypothetical protein